MATQVKATLKAEYVNPFLKSTLETFSTMVGTKLSPEKIFLRKQDPEGIEIAGIIGLSGDVVGSIIIGFTKPVALKAASTFVGEEFTEVNEDVADAIGELANIIAGNAKKYTSSFSIDISLPSVISGKDVVINIPKDAPVMCIPLASDLGKFTLDVAMKPGK